MSKNYVNIFKAAWNSTSRIGFSDGSFLPKTLWYNVANIKSNELYWRLTPIKLISILNGTLTLVLDPGGLASLTSFWCKT